MLLTAEYAFNRCGWRLSDLWENPGTVFVVSCINVLYYRHEDLWDFVLIGHFFHEVKPMYFIDLVAILSGFKTSFRTFFKTKKHFLSLQVL